MLIEEDEKNGGNKQSNEWGIEIEESKAKNDNNAWGEPEQ